MSKPKVLLVGKLPPPYIGPAVATEILLNSALKKEYELLHLNTTVNQTVEDFGKGGISKVFRNIRIYINLFKLLLTNRPDLVLLPISQTTLGFAKDAVLIWIIALFRTKLLLQLRGSNFKNWMKQSSAFTRFWVRLSLKRAKGIIVLGHNLKHLFEAYFKADQIYVVPNGCDLEIPKKQSGTEKGQEGKVKLLYFANFLPQKGIKEVIQAIRLLKEAGLGDFILDAVGDWDNATYQKECEALINNHALPIRFHNSLSGKLKWQMFGQAEVFIFVPNKPEGHPWVIVEALAAALPIISTDQGAITESVLDGTNGFIVEPNSPEQIANKLKLLIENKPLRKNMGEASSSHYQQHFTEQQMVKNLSFVFKQIIE